MSATSPAHARLRAASADDHVRVDGCFPQGLDDVTAYRRYLRGMHALLVALADADAGLAQAYAHHRMLLEADMAALSIAPLAAPQAPRIDDDATRLGARYVIEGSAMGARLLLRQATALGFDRESGARFLAYHAEQGGAQWPQFKQQLASQDPADPGFARLIQTTCDTFALAARCLGGDA